MTHTPTIEDGVMWLVAEDGGREESCVSRDEARELAARWLQRRCDAIRVDKAGREGDCEWFECADRFGEIVRVSVSPLYVGRL